MRSFLLQPYPFSEKAGRRLAVCGGVGLFVFLFLLLFKPFGFDNLPPGEQWTHAGLFGAATFLISAFFQVILPRILPSLFREEEWRSWKEILYLLITTAFIGAGNFLLMRLLYPSETTLSGFLRAQLITFEIGVFPILFVVFLKQLTLYRRFAAEANEVKEDLQAEKADEPVDPSEISDRKPLLLRGDNQKEELSVLPGNLLCLSSADNYVKLQFEENGLQRSVLFRSTLKKMEEQLSGHSQFFRCHRMHLVNLQRVKDVTGNAQGLKLHLAGLEEPVPVSRSLTETVKERLHGLSRSPQNT